MRSRQSGSGFCLFWSPNANPILTVPAKEALRFISVSSNCAALRVRAATGAVWSTRTMVLAAPSYGLLR